MYNPIRLLTEGLRDEDRQKKLRPHSSVEALEFLAVFSFIPSFVIFLYAFIFSAATYLASAEVAKNNFWLGGIIYTVFNIFPALFGLVLLLEPEYRVQGIGLAGVYGGMGVWGAMLLRSKSNMPPQSPNESAQLYSPNSLLLPTQNPNTLIIRNNRRSDDVNQFFFRKGLRFWQ